VGVGAVRDVLAAGLLMPVAVPIGVLNPVGFELGVPEGDFEVAAVLLRGLTLADAGDGADAGTAVAFPLAVTMPATATPLGVAPGGASPAEGLAPDSTVELASEPSALRGGADLRSKSSGSTSPADSKSVGIKPESSGRGGKAVAGLSPAPMAGAFTAGADSRPSSAPCARRSSGSTMGDESDDAEEGGGENLAPSISPAGRPVSIGCSTGRSAKGSKTGREAASIDFEPDSVPINPGGILQWPRTAT
jgi:hypothetical protein